MIRFVDIRGQGTGYRFAFWNTTVDRFVTVGSAQGWEDWEHLKADYATWGFAEASPGSLDRLKGLMPEWAFEPMRDDEPL